MKKTTVTQMNKMHKKSVKTLMAPAKHSKKAVRSTSPKRQAY